MNRLAANFLLVMRMTACTACVAFFAVSGSAQELWKYTDKNGKVTYADKAPMSGEKAERVNTDTTGTVLPAAKNFSESQPQRRAPTGSWASEREAAREIYRKNVDAAREQLEKARKTLEAGREPTPDERQIVVGRGKDGRPTGANAVIRKPEFDERIAGLEADVKKAEAKVEGAEKAFREKAPQ